MVQQVQQQTQNGEMMSAIADMISALHGAAFPSALGRFLGSIVPFDHLTVFRYCLNGAPSVLSHDHESRRGVDSLNTYLAGPYLLDPFFEACYNPEIIGVIHRKDIAPDHFFRSEYYRSYYAKTPIIDEVGFYASFAEGVFVVPTIQRYRGSRPFRKKEIERLHSVEPIVREAVTLHWRDVESLIDSAGNGTETGIDTLPDRVRNVVTISGRPNLTNRESEVVSLVLRGYSSIAIASILDISAATVKVHRKNIYSKLKISSQAELFSLFMPLLSRMAA